MNNIVILSEADGLPWEAMSQIFMNVGWGQRPPVEIQNAFQRSSFVRFAYHNARLVGFGRTVDDGKYYALIADLVVDPQYQGKGIGQRILDELREELKGYLFTTLTAAPGKDGFYLKQGWKRQKTSFIWPRSQSQLENHAIPGEQGAQPDAFGAG